MDRGESPGLSPMSGAVRPAQALRPLSDRPQWGSSRPVATIVAGVKEIADADLRTRHLPLQREDVAHPGMRAETSQIPRSGRQVPTRSADRQLITASVSFHVVSQSLDSVQAIDNQILPCARSL